MQRIDHARGCNDCRSVLIVVKDRNVHQLTQAAFYDETVWCLDVFEIDAAKRWS